MPSASAYSQSPGRSHTPCRRTGTSRMPPAKRGAGLRDVAVRLQGVWLRPGDWLYADADGIVVLDRPWAA